MKNTVIFGASIWVLAGFAACSAPNEDKAPAPVTELENADICLENAHIYVNPNMEGRTLTVKDGLITAIGGNTKKSVSDNLPNCKAFRGTSTKIIDMHGAYVYPGFVDTHAHLLGIGLREMTLNLEGTKSLREVVDRLATEVAKTPKGQTVYGRGWIETHWPEHRFPNRSDLDKVSPDNPVILQRADGHAVIVNSAALKAAGIDKNTKPPFGGDILKGKNGVPTGMIIDNAMSLIEGLKPKLTPERRRSAYIKASEVYAAYGWTGLHSMSAIASDVPLIETLSDQGKLKIRVYNAVDLKGADALLDDIAKNGPHTSKNGRIVTRAIKLYMDGALGSRGAALLAPYADDPGNSGLILSHHADVLPVLERALKDGIQVSVHAIGDRGNRTLLDWYAEAFEAVPQAERKIKQPRWRDEHSQIINPADIPRFAAMGIIASMQPSHAIGDLYFAPDRLGMQRLKGAYAWKSLEDAGVVVTGGSDAPVERGDPRIEFYAAVARKSLDGFSGPGWHPEQALSRSAALDVFTKNAAYAAFKEGQMGEIKPGQAADFTVFDKDILTIPAAEILKVKPVMTMVDGEVIYGVDTKKR